MKFPESFAVLGVVTSRPISVIVILALGTAELLESVTVPVMLPYTACAIMGEATEQHHKSCGEAGRGFHVDSPFRFPVKRSLASKITIFRNHNQYFLIFGWLENSKLSYWTSRA